jgi:pimeloyl-ACP methyl ester carboxylesterase
MNYKCKGSGMRDAFWFQGIKAFSETDFTEDLKKFDVPTLIIHGDDDQIVRSLKPGEEIGAEIHKNSDRLFHNFISSTRHIL